MLVSTSCWIEPDVELRRLEYFLAVAEEASFTKASQRLHVAQSAISTQVASLERELGVRLLERSSRAVRVTSAGRVLVERARQALDALTLARAEVAAQADQLRGTAAIGTNFRPPGLDVPRLLAGFSQRHPLVDVTLREETTPQMVTAVRRGELDVAIISFLPGQAPTGLWCHEIVTEPILAVLGCDHPLADEEAVSLGQLAAWPAIELREGTALRSQADELWRQGHLERNVVFDVWHVETMIELAATGLGVALLPKSIVEHSTTPARHDVVARSIAGLTARRVVAAVARPDGRRSPIGEALLGHVLAQLSEQA